MQIFDQVTNQLFAYLKVKWHNTMRQVSFELRVKFYTFSNVPPLNKILYKNLQLIKSAYGFIIIKFYIFRLYLIIKILIGWYFEQYKTDF